MITCPFDKYEIGQQHWNVCGIDIAPRGHQTSPSLCLPISVEIEVIRYGCLRRHSVDGSKLLLISIKTRCLTRLELGPHFGPRPAMPALARQQEQPLLPVSATGSIAPD